MLGLHLDIATNWVLLNNLWLAEQTIITNHKSVHRSQLVTRLAPFGPPSRIPRCYPMHPWAVLSWQSCTISVVHLLVVHCNPWAGQRQCRVGKAKKKPATSSEIFMLLLTKALISHLTLCRQLLKQKAFPSHFWFSARSKICTSEEARWLRLSLDINEGWDSLRKS